MVLLVLFSLTVLTLDFRDVGIVQDARHAVGRALSPLQGAADTVGSPFANAWNGITHYGDVTAENDELRARIDELEGTVSQATDVRRQLDELLEQTDIPWVGDLATATARVIQEPVTSFSHAIVIDKGSTSGIAVGMPAVTGAGLVGTVVDVEPGRSTIQLISDPEFRVGVRMSTSQRFGTARGQGANRSLRVDTGIEPTEPDAEVPDDEILTTSGIDERSSFPALIPVARVVRTRTINGGLTVELIAEPLARLGELSYVNVVLTVPVS